MFIDFRPNAPVTAVFRAEDSAIMYQNPDGEYSPVLLRGVEINPVTPANLTWDFSATMEDYLRWFAYIYEMGANTLYVTNIMDPDFYNALHKFNTTNDRYLLLLQGVHGYNYATLTMALREVIDIIHGRRINLFGNTGVQAYRAQISEWVVGLVVGAEWDPDDIVFANHFDPSMPDSFEGQFFSAAYGASPFEVMLAMVMDNATTYESRRFKVQRPIGFISNPTIDFLEYSWAYATQLRKYVQLDHENVIPSEHMIAGTFAAYRLFYFTDDFLTYLTPSQLATLRPLLEDLNKDCNFNGYLDLLARYHSMPVIAAGVGFSSSRAPHIMDRDPLTEREQGQAIANVISQLEERSWAGSFISTWQDQWEQRTWNSAFSSNPWRYQYWHNLMSVAGGYGIMAFDPGRYQRPVLIDGSASSWDYSHLVHEHEGISIYAQYSVHGLYLLVQGSDISPQNTFYLPIDVTPNSGTSVHDHMEFARPSDFLLVLSGAHDSRLMVDRRYHATYQRFSAEIRRVNPYVYIPPVWDSGFVPITIALQNTLVVDEHTFEFLTDEAREMRLLHTRDVGRLTHGVVNPSSPSFNSLADFYFGENMVEIRIPWMLLNFYDPSVMQVHDDYFSNWGVEGLSIDYMHIGIARGSSTVPMSPIALTGWGDNVEFHERLKQSYFVIQEVWRR